LKWNAIAYGVVAVLGLAALVGLYACVPALRRRWFPVSRLRPGAWLGHDVFLAFCIFLGFPRLIVDSLQLLGFFTPLLGSEPDAPPLDKLLYGSRCTWISSPLTLAAVLGLLFAVLFARSGARPHHYGLSWARWPANVGLGIIAFVLGKPIVLGIFALSVLVFTPRPDPIDGIAQLHPPEWEWALLAFHTTVAAPLLEEITIRGILQGWLRRTTLSGHLTFLTMTLFLGVLLHSGDVLGPQGDAEPREHRYAPLAFAAVLAVGYGFALYRLTARFQLSETEIQQWQPAASLPPLDGSFAASEEQAQQLKRQLAEADEARNQRWADANARLAVLGSASLFAMIHPWPAALALFPMGLMLGWLAYRTQSLIGPIVFHMLFNLSTFIALYASVLSKAQ
jgi:membrane protease YdiL (CAAX protease family)